MGAIGIDYTPAYEQGGGIGRLVRELIRALAQTDQTTQYQLFVAGAIKSHLLASLGPNFHWNHTRLSPTWLARIWYRANLPLPIEWFTGNIDLFHATDFVLPPTHKTTRTLVTVHDLSFIRVPDAASPRLKTYLDKVVPHSVRRADHILADSQATKDDLITLYNLPAEKITVLLSGVDNHFHLVTDKNTLEQVRAKYQIPDRPYIFSVGTIQPRKNYERMIRSLAQVRNRGFDVSLVIAGGKGWLSNPIYTTIEETHMADYVHLIGFAKDQDLPALYTGATLTAFPSLYEGFGFPVLESMACGTPVITSNISSLPEVAGNAALLINPLNIDEITFAIQRLLEDTTLRKHLIEQGFQQAQSFTWQASAQHLMEIYAKILNRS